MPSGGQHVAPPLTMRCIVSFMGGRCRWREVGGELIQEWPKTVSQEVALECLRVKIAGLDEPRDNFLAQQFQPRVAAAAAAEILLVARAAMPGAASSGCESRASRLISCREMPAASRAGPTPSHPEGFAGRRLSARAAPVRSRRQLLLQALELIQQARSQVGIAGELGEPTQPPARGPPAPRAPRSGGLASRSRQIIRDRVCALDNTAVSASAPWRRR